MPTLVGVYTDDQGNNTTALSFTIPDVAVDDVLVFKGGNGWTSGGRTVNNPTTTGETWQSQLARSPSNGCYGRLSTLVATSAGTKTVTATVSGGNMQHCGVVEHWTDAALDPTPVVGFSDNGGSAPSAAISPEAAESVISWASFDWNAMNTASAAYRNGAVEEFTAGVTGVDYGAYFAWQDVAAAGATTFGLTAPTGQKPTMVGIEILHAGGAGPVDVPLGQPVETDTAAALTRSKVAGVGQVLETDTAHPVAAAKVDQLGQVLEVDVAHPVGAGKTVTLGLPVETSTAHPVSSGSAVTVTLGLPVDTAAAHQLAIAKTAGVGQPAETGTAAALTRSKTATLGQVLEVDVAHPVTSSTPDGVTVTLGLPIETATTAPLAAAKAQTLGRPVETATAPALAPNKATLLGLPTTTDTAAAAALAKALGLGVGLEVDEAWPVVAVGPEPPEPVPLAGARLRFAGVDVRVRGAELDARVFGASITTRQEALP